MGDLTPAAGTRQSRTEMAGVWSSLAGGGVSLVVGAEVDMVSDPGEELLRRLEHAPYLGTRDAVEVLPPDRAVDDQPAVLEAREMSGDVRLRPADLRHQVGDAPFTPLQGEQNGKPGRVREAPEELRGQVY